MGWPWLSLASLCAAAGAVTAALLIYEQINCYFRRKRVDGSPLPGPGLVVPLIGGLAKMIWSPVRFWENQRLFATNGLSSNYLAGIYVCDVNQTAVLRSHLAAADPEAAFRAASRAINPVASSLARPQVPKSLPFA